MKRLKGMVHDMKRYCALAAVLLALMCACGCAKKTPPAQQTDDDLVNPTKYEAAQTYDSAGNLAKGETAQTDDDLVNPIKYETAQTEFGMPVLTVHADLECGIDSIVMVKASENGGEDTIVYSILRNGAKTASDPIALNQPGSYYYRVTSTNGDVYEMAELLIATDENGDGVADGYTLKSGR